MKDLCEIRARNFVLIKIQLKELKVLLLKLYNLVLRILLAKIFFFICTKDFFPTLTPDTIIDSN